MEKTEIRDCGSCVYASMQGCVAWSCGYINREEAVEAWKELYENQEETAL